MTRRVYPDERAEAYFDLRAAVEDLLVSLEWPDASQWPELAEIYWQLGYDK